MNIIKLSLLTVLFVIFQLYAQSQVNTVNDIINIYDPFTITINEMTLNSTDDEFRENPFIFILTISFGNEKVIKFLKPDDILINSAAERDNYTTYNFNVKRNNTILMPALYNIQNSSSQITFRFEAFSSIAEIDQVSLNNLSSSFVYTSSNMNNHMELAYKYLTSNTDVNRSNSALLTSAEVLQQNVKTRSGVVALGNPVEGSFVIPQDPQKVVGPNVFVQGKKTLENRVGNRQPDIINFTVTKLSDVKIVTSQPYFVKLKGVFQELTSYNIIPLDRREGMIAKAHELITNDLTLGLKPDVYINNQVSRQLSNVLNLLKAGVRAKADSLSETNSIMISDEREALSYIDQNMRENEYNIDNQYIYDEFINSSVNRGILQKEIDRIKRYYQIK